MAINRRNMITRTVKSTAYTCMEVSVADASVAEVVYELPGDFDEKAINKIQKKYQTEDKKIVAVTYHVTREQLYGLPVDTFLNLATPLTDRAEVEDSDTEE